MFLQKFYQSDMKVCFRLIKSAEFKNICKTGITVWILLLLQYGVSLGAETALKKASFCPAWIPQAQFAGYMVALEKGFYREAGLDLNLLVGGPEKPPFVALEAGEAMFCTDWLSSGIQKRATGTPIVNLAQISQRSALILVAKKKSGIEQAQDLNGKNVGLWPGLFYIQPMVFFEKYGLKVNVITNYTSVSLFLKGGVDAMSAMWYNEYHLMLNSGLNSDDLTLFFFSRLGLNFPEDGIYCLEQTLREDPNLCEAFVRASIKGWLYAFENQDDALDIIMKHAKAAHTGTNKAHQRWMLARMKELIIPEGDARTLGKLYPADYALVSDILKDSNLIHQVPQYNDFYRGPK
ncbi:MAG TPA: ABC transporter substrate-binding protein [Desulfomonilaceae bacterium]|nr:ABC transporter substrate-binding protein [Desulfomonilaceae bacterium]